jgi:hypothetical protein
LAIVSSIAVLAGSHVAAGEPQAVPASSDIPRTATPSSAFM